MRGRLNIWPLFLFVLLTACADDEYNEENDLSKKLVVEAYVYANEPIDHVKISRVHDQGQAARVPLSTANVHVAQNGNEYQLIPHPQEAGLYIQEDTSITPAAEGPLELKITHEGMTHISATEMPTQIQGLEISSQVVDVVPGDTSSVVATISWQSVENAPGYCIFIRNIGEDATPISNYTENTGQNPFVIVNHSTQVELKGAHFSHFGTYEIYVTAVNQEYIDVYSNPSETNLSTAPTNIQNGWGVFTAFNGQTLTFTVQ